MAAAGDLMNAMPPTWAESLLKEFLAREDFETVSGDLLEQYRDSVLPARGERAADRWYVAQVLAAVARRTAVWAGLFAGAFLARAVLDGLVPTADFHTRATISTYSGLSILTLAGLRAAWRSGSPSAGLLAGAATTILAAIISATGAAAFLAIRHDPATLAAIDRSGGLGEAFGLPVMMIIPGVVLGSIGGLAGASLRRLRGI